MTIELCPCGTPRNTNGSCPHCDTPGPGPHPDTCPHCRWRDHTCAICHTRCPSIAAAKVHEARCRTTEEAEERKRTP